MAAIHHDPLLSLLLVLLCVGTAVWGSPKCQWPMTKQAVLKDVENDNTGTLVNGDTCPYLVEDPPNTGSFYYGIKDRSVAEFSIPDGDFKKYSFTLWVKPLPSVLNSISNIDLFEYQSDSWDTEGGNIVTKVYAHVIPGGKVKLTLAKLNILTTMESRVPLSSSVFSSVVFSVDADERNMYVTINTEVNETPMADVFPLKTPGKWRIGQFITQEHGKPFEGKIKCATFFDYYVTIEKLQEYNCTSSDSSNGNCKFQPEPQIVTTSAMTTGATTTIEEATSPPPTTTAATTTVEEATSPPPTTTAATMTVEEATIEEVTSPPPTTAATMTVEEATIEEVTSPPPTTAATTTVEEPTSPPPTTTAATTTVEEATIEEVTSPPPTTAATMTVEEATIEEVTSPPPTTAATTTVEEATIEEVTSPPPTTTTAATTTIEVTSPPPTTTTAATTTIEVTSPPPTTTTAATTTIEVTSPPPTTTITATTTVEVTSPPPITTTAAITTTVEEVTSPLATETASSTATPTSNQTSPVSPSPQYFWPLGNVTRGYDIMSGAAPWTSPNELGCLRVGGKVSLNRSGTVSNLLPLLMDGSWRSSLSLRVNASALGSTNFTTVLFIRPLEPCEGKLWTFTASARSSSSTIGVSRVEVRLEANCSVVAEAWNSGAADSPCGKVVTDARVLGYDAVTMLTVEKDAESLTVRVGRASEWTAKHSCDGGCGASCGATDDTGTGSLRIGERFRGSLVCLAVFFEVLPPASLDEDEYFDQCVNGYGSSLQVPAAVYNCNTTPPELQQGRFRLVARDAVPNAAMTTTSVPMAVLPTTAAVHCAAGCLLTRHCRAFALQKFTAGQPLPRSCQLFDFVTDHGLVSSPGSNYYEIVSAP